MNIAIAIVIVVSTIILGNPQIASYLVASFIAGVLFVILHDRLIKPVKDAPIGIAYLLFVLGVLIAIMFPKISSGAIQISALFLAGTLFYTSFREINSKARVA